MGLKEKVIHFQKTETMGKGREQQKRSFMKILEAVTQIKELKPLCKSTLKCKCYLHQEEMNKIQAG